MKSLLLAGAALIAAAGLLHAQSLTITAPGYATAKLFDATAGFTITGLAAAPGGDVFYIETDAAFTAPSKLYRRSAADGYASAATLFDFGAFAFGSFIVWDAGRLLFGENSTGVIRALNADLTIDPLGVVPGNYDLALSGGSLFISHNPGGFSAQNRVSRFTLESDGLGGQQLSAADLILDTAGDYSGPIAFDAAGALFYGGSGFFGKPDLYRYTAAEVGTAAPALALDPAHRYLATGTNAYLASDGAAALWHTDFATLNLIDTTTPGITTIAITDDSIGHLAFLDGVLFANITAASFDHSAVYIVVPEPSAAAFLLLGLGAVAVRRRRPLR